MIIVQLIGGLGNQLFQYATARRLASIHNVPLKIDITRFFSYTLHSYSLHAFNIIENLAGEEDLIRVQKPFSTELKSPLKIIKTKLYRMDPIISVREKHFHFNPEILNLPDNTYLEGYWQSEKYFKDVEKIIRNELTFKIPPDPINKEFGDKILSVNSVSLHIRRGDYVTDPITNETHGVCDIEYYQKAIGEIVKIVANPHFFVFSDDPEWAKSHIKIDAPTEYVTHNDSSKNYEDIRLMSMCHHNIIANSSFSWWGAWLNSNPRKMVIAPKKWFRKPDINTEDLIPESWTLI
jgi:hypothetical protein